jgi:hypothetical protein
VRKVAGIAFLLFCGLMLVFVAVYLVAATQFDLPPGPPIVAVGLVALACAGVTRLVRRQR